MATDDLLSGEPMARPPAASARAFTVRVWKEELGGGSEYRGVVRDVLSNAHRGFRDWSDLVAFMVVRLEQEERHVDR